MKGSAPLSMVMVVFSRAFRLGWGVAIRANRMREYFRLDRGRFLTIVLFVLPVAAYFAGSGTYQFYGIGNENIVAALSLVPRFDWMYRWYIGNFGVEGAQRFLIVAFYFMLLFPVQIVLMTCLAVHDLRPSSTFKPLTSPTAMASLVFVVALCILFFFFPFFPKDMNTRMGRVVMFTDVKYFLIAGLYGFFVISYYIVIYLVGREVRSRKPSNSG